MTWHGVVLTPDMDVILVIHLYEILNTAGVACEWGIALEPRPVYTLYPSRSRPNFLRNLIQASP